MVDEYEVQDMLMEFHKRSKEGMIEKDLQELTDKLVIDMSKYTVISDRSSPNNKNTGNSLNKKKGG